MRLQLSPRKQVEFRRSYRALLAQGMTVSAAAKTLGVYTERIRHDLFAHPLGEPLPDLDNMLTASELAAAVGISYQQLQKRLARCRVSPAMRYARIFWYRRDAVERLKDGTERYEAIPLDRIGEVKTLATNFTTRKIYLFEQGAPIERIADPCDKCVSPAVAEAECRVWRKRLDPEHYARLEQLLRFRVATWRARIQRNREGFEPSAAGREPRGQYRPDDGGAGSSASLGADRARVARNREGFEPSSAGSIGDCGERQRTRLKQAGSGTLSRLRGVRITGDAE